MTTNQHPITPPTELVQEWTSLACEEEGCETWSSIATQAARWGADQQLAEDAKWLDQHALDAPHLKITPVGESLKEAMRPKPPSLKEQALVVLDGCSNRLDSAHENTIRKALEEKAALTKPVPSADGEIARLAVWLRCQKGQVPGSYTEFDRRIDRAADLLSRLAPQPKLEGFN